MSCLSSVVSQVRTQITQDASLLFQLVKQTHTHQKKCVFDLYNQQNCYFQRQPYKIQTLTTDILALASQELVVGLGHIGHMIRII